MKFWNGYYTQTLESRGWDKVILPFTRVNTLDSTAFLDWFNTHQSDGRWFVEPGEPFGPGNTYYFENKKDAIIFALKWL